MNIAKISAQRSKDPVTQVGSCVVSQENIILGIGYNGFPRGCSDDEFPWTKPEKSLYVCHAEMNALLGSNNINLVKGSRLYTTLFPCNNCTKIIIQLGVKEIIYLEDKYPNKIETIASRKMLDAVGITYQQYVEPSPVLL
jgi:dCMP deaminase